MAVRPRLSLLRTLACMGTLMAMAAAASAQNAASPATPDSKIASYWGEVIKDAAPSPAPATTVPAPKVVTVETPAGNFLNHFYFDTHTEFTHGSYSFSGQPTATGVIDALPGSGVNTSGFPYLPAFQSDTNTMYSYLNTGTRGLGSDRINTNFALRYRQDVTNLLPGSPGLSVINTFGGSHLFEITSGYVEINGKPSDGWFANSSVRLGRQTIYGPYLAQFDGASYTHNGNRYSFTAYGGRRFTYYSDPFERGIGGLDLTVRLTDKVSVGYHGLYYLKGTNALSYEERFGESWILSSYFRMVGSHPVDFTASTFWSPSNGKTTIGVSFFQKITNNDYTFDYALAARDNDSFNTYPRLYLGLLEPYSQFSIDARRTVNSYLRLGGALVVRHLNNSNDQGPFDTSFQDYRVDTQVFPWRKIETFVQYHQHNSDRVNPNSTVAFGDVSTAGETRVQDLSVELGRGFFENRVNLRGGAFFRRINFPGRLLRY